MSKEAHIFIRRAASQVLGHSSNRNESDSERI